MSPELFPEMAAVQQRHWWFMGRRQILSCVIDRLQLPRQANILEIGCGTGANLEMLRQKGHLHAMEFDDQARAMANSLALCEVSAGGLPEPVAHMDQSMDRCVYWTYWSILKTTWAHCGALRDFSNLEDASWSQYLLTNGFGPPTTQHTTIIGATQPTH